MPTALDTALKSLAKYMTPPNQDPELAREYPVGTKVYGRKGTEYAQVAAVSTGHFRRCQMDGCTGVRVRVIWPGGTVKWLCTKSLEAYRSNSKQYRLI